MIAAAEPLEFIPRGRKIVDLHPGSLARKHDNIPSEFILLDRMQNVNLHKDEHFNENWIIREVYQAINTSEELAFLTPTIVNSEDELYFRGNTAVWSSGLFDENREKASSEICYTSEGPIQFAFFCTKNFLDADFKIENKPTKQQENEMNKGVGIIDTNSLKVYATNGENLVTSIETPITKIWITKYCVVVEKEASSTIIDGHTLAMPRIFSLGHPLDDMFPVLLKSNTLVNYITEAEYKIIFTTEDSDMILMFDARTGMHLVFKLRKATDEETASVNALYDTATMDMNTASSIGGFSTVNNSMRHSNIQRQSVSGRNLQSTSNVFSHSPLINSPGDAYRSKLASSLVDSSTHRNSISVMARKIGECEPSKPLVPDLIMEQVWVESSNTWNEYHEMASSGFLHMDFIGQKYLCFMLTKSYKLNMLAIDRINGINTPIFGSMSSISAKDAIALPRMNMVVVLMPCGTLMLYSGPIAVGKVHVGGILTTHTITTTFTTPGFPKRSSLLPNVKLSADTKFDDEIHMLSPVHPLHSNKSPIRLNNCNAIRDPAGNRVTLSFANGKMYRLGLPAMCESTVVRKIIVALRQVMPKSSLKLMIRWYVIRNSPGTKDLSLRKEWELFKSLLMEMMGRPHEVSSSSNSSSTVGAKKRRKSENGTNADWEYLLAAGYHSTTDGDEEDHEMVQTYHSDAVLFANIPAILYTIHLLYENMKLDNSLSTELKFLSELLFQLAIDFDLEKYQFHYIVDNPQLIDIKSKMTIASVDSEKLLRKELIGDPLNIFQEVFSLINNKLNFKKFPFISNVNVMSRDVFEILAIIFEKTKSPSEAIEMVKVTEDQKMPITAPVRKSNSPISIQKIIIDALIRKKITRTQLERLPTSLNYIISQALETCRLNPPMGCSAPAYKLLLRPELFAHAAFKKDKKQPKLGRVQLETSLTPRIQTPPDVIAKSEKALVEDDGMEHIDTKLLRLRFPDDLRINDVKKFLNSSKPVIIDIVQSPNVSDHDFIEEQEKQLFAMCTRTMALPVGRGMFTFRTYYPILTEILPIPKLCLTGKETGRGATIEMQQIEVPANMSVWPQFHNGVAAGLRIATDPSDIDPAYIMYNKPKDAEIPPTYAGFLMALGLTSSLNSLSATYLYDYLIRSEELLSVGLIIGMASSYRGTMDTKITRMLSIHVESLLPPTAIELDVSHNVQVAALLGIGLLYQNSNKRYIAEALLQEINRPPGPEMENYVERESYALSAGLALGMVTLATGNKDVGLEDLNIPDTLHYYMTGGTKRSLTGTQRDKYKLPSFQIREGDQVNIDVTAPGSTLALGLMFFGSGNLAVADWMKPPETMFLLDFVRPDLLLLRVIARGLIMWHSVEPSTEWINSQISKTLSKIIKQRPDPDNDPYDMDHEAICQAYCNIVTGAAVVIGLRYAGTENPIAFKTLKKIITFFLSANGQYIGEYAGKATVESCIILVLIALSLVFAGTGNLHILRMIRMTRSRIGPQHSQVTYGSHMAIHMALGFLFLGAGRYTISRRPEAIAALICALFPKFPTHSNDNRYHLQAFRHLYVLAVEPRLFLPRDIDSGKLVVCKLSYVEFDQKNVSVTMAPSMLPELNTLKAVYVNDPNYWPVTFERGRNWEQLIMMLQANGCIDIVQRAGCLSHLDDPNRLKSLLAQTLTTEKFSSWKVEPSNLLSFSNDRLMVNLTKMMLMIPQFPLVDEQALGDKSTDDFREMILLQAYDCLTRDKIHALGIYMALDNVVRFVKQKESSINCNEVWQLKIMQALVKKLQMNDGTLGDSSALLSMELLNSLLMRFKMTMDEKLKEQKRLLRSILMEKNLKFLHERSANEIKELIQLVVFFDIPMNFLNEPIDLQNVNLVQFMFEMKKRQIQPLNADFLINLYKLLS